MIQSMPLPAVVITATYPAYTSGYVTFTTLLRSDGDTWSVLGGSVSAYIRKGKLRAEIEVPAPELWRNIYVRVTERFSGGNATDKTYLVRLTGETMNLDTAEKMDSPPPAGVYVLESALGQPGGIATLDKAGVLNSAQRPAVTTDQGTTDHSALAALHDDSHPQYLTQTRADELYPQTATLAPVATTGAYHDLAATPSIPKAFAELTGKVPAAALPTYAKVATTGSYADLVDAPSIPRQYGDLTGAVPETALPAYARVAKTGSYSDLVNCPFIPTQFSDLAGAVPAAALPTFAAVATSGAYTDLTGRPSIPTKFSDLSGAVPAAALPTQSAVAASGSYNDLTDRPAIPSKYSDLTGAVPAAALPAQSAVATSGAYADLTGRPTIPSKYSDLTGAVPASALPVFAPVATTGKYSDLTGRPSIPATFAELTGTVPASALPPLATVATTGKYSDLTGRPTIPTTYSDLAGAVPASALPTFASVATSGKYTDLTGRPSIPATYAELTGTVPASALPMPVNRVWSSGSVRPGAAANADGTASVCLPTTGRTGFTALSAARLISSGTFLLETVTATLTATFSDGTTASTTFTVTALGQQWATQAALLPLAKDNTYVTRYALTAKSTLGASNAVVSMDLVATQS